MKIYYQGFPGAYSNKASIETAKKLKIPTKDIYGLYSFKEVFDQINLGNIGVLPIENSYAGSIHENFYHIISGKYKIIGEIFLDINHFLLGNTKDINDIKEAHSHPQALMQCQKYLESKNILAKINPDTAGAAKFVKESSNKAIASISSDLCSDIYGLEILDKNIQDQKGNTTRFFIIVTQELFNKEKDFLKFPKIGKISINFKTKDIPSALYKCLGAFATRFINLSKIESLPSKENRFEYIFWIDFEKKLEENIIKDALEELSFFCKDLNILGDY